MPDKLKSVKTDNAQGVVQADNIENLTQIFYGSESSPAPGQKPSESEAKPPATVSDESVKVFVSYAREDYKTAKRLYDDLKKAGVSPWMDKADLLPGQNWKVHITRAVRESKYFIALLSSDSLSKRGFVQKELKLALDILDEFPDEDIFVIPVRVNDCEPIDEKLKYLHRADIFPSYEDGLSQMLRVLVPEPKSEPNENFA